MNSGANAPEYGTVSSDYVKLATVDDDNVGASGYNFTNCFANATYQSYQLRLNWTNTTAQTPRLTFLDSSNNELTGSNSYKRVGGQAYRNYPDNADSNFTSWNNALGLNYADLTGWNNLSGTQTAVQAITVDFDMPYPNSSNHKTFKTNGWGYSTGNYLFYSWSGFVYTGTGAVTGFRVKNGGGNITKLYATLYGLKK